MTTQFDNALMTVSPFTLVTIWADLVEAYHGVANCGEMAEIYAYRLMPYSPRAHAQGDKVLAHEIAVQAANALCAIVEEFCSDFHYNCVAQIDNLTIEQWCRAHNYGGGRVYDYRCYVRIIRKDRPK